MNWALGIEPCLWVVADIVSVSGADVCACVVWGYKVVDRVAYTKKRANRNRIVDAAATIVSWRKASGTFRTYYLYCSM